MFARDFHLPTTNHPSPNRLRGADINSCNYKGNSPLHFCFKYGFGSTLGAYLISKGADVTIRNGDGRTFSEQD